MNNRDNPEQSSSQNPAEAIVLHLLQHPFALVDTTYLMKQFGASADDVRRALSTLEHRTRSYEEKPVC